MGRMVLGAIIATVGLLITLGTYGAASSSPDGGRVVIAWGAIVAGALIFISGLRERSSSSYTSFPITDRYTIPHPQTIPDSSSEQPAQDIPIAEISKEEAYALIEIAFERFPVGGSRAEWLTPAHIVRYAHDLPDCSF
jgi:hypothetical protein